jgi:hypothetical protein
LRIMEFKNLGFALWSANNKPVVAMMLSEQADNIGTELQ